MAARRIKERRHMSIGIWQIVLILAIVLIIFGAGKLPRVMGDVAKGVKNFKSGMKEGAAPDTSTTTSTAAGEDGKVIDQQAAPSSADTASVKNSDEAAKS
jgi:sec-independent protein translocase protein TatA